MRASYGSYYRRMMPKLLTTLKFRSNNGTHRPLLDALDAIRRAEGEGRQFFKADEVAIEGVIRPKWRDIVLEDVPGGGQRVNRINYEICVLQTLRERLRCKEAWVVGAGRFRNPDADLPADFAERRAKCYERLGLPTEARAFADALRAEMTEVLGQFNRSLPRNPGVRLDPRRHPIIVTPLDPLPEPFGLGAIKAEIGRRWLGMGLLDVFKEADLRIGFTDAFVTAASREATDRDEVRRRLLLNVVETWNSANGFIFFGKGGEVASNRLDDQEASVHALHLLQSCLVYVNTLMLQRVLPTLPGWRA